MKKAIISLIITTAVLCILYLVFIPIGKIKYYRYKTQTVFLPNEEGDIFSALDWAEPPYEFNLYFHLDCDTFRPKEIVFESITLSGTKSGLITQIKDQSSELKYTVQELPAPPQDRAHANFCFEKIPFSEGTKYEPINVDLVIKYIMEDGSEIPSSHTYRIETDYRERTKIPWWYPL